MARHFCLGCLIIDTLSARRSSHNEHEDQHYDPAFDAQLERDDPVATLEFPSLAFRPMASPVFSDVMRVLGSDRVSMSQRVHHHSSRPVCPVCGWLTASRSVVA